MVERGDSKVQKKILGEIKYLLNLGVKSIYFFDETFTVQKKRVLDLCELIKKQGLNFEWGCNGRVDTLDEETIKIMKTAGCWNIMFGIECGSEGLLEDANKGTTLKKAIAMVDACKKNGISVSASFVIGFPNETWENVKQTLKIAKKVNPYRAQFVVLTPYPGTRLYDEVKSKGLLERDYSFSGYDAYCVNQIPVIRTEKLSSEELAGAQQVSLSKILFKAFLSDKCSFRNKIFWSVIKYFKIRKILKIKKHWK